ncbi:hypothetical protein BG006_002863, partial [Podila minutissima]
MPHCIKHHPDVVLDVVLSTIVEHAHFGSAVATPSLAPTDAPTENEFVEALQVTPSPVDTSISDVSVSSLLPLPSMSFSGIKVASKVARSDSNSLASTVASGALISLNDSVDQLSIKSNILPDVDPFEPLHLCPSKKSTIQIQDDMKAVTDAMIAANRAGKPLDTSIIHSIVTEILSADVRNSMATPAMAVLETKSTVIKKLDALHDQGEMTQHIIREVLEETQRIKDRLILIESKTTAILTQNYELLEYTIPRLFIVLPETSTSWDPAAMFRTKFRLHFICECGEHTKASGSKIPHHLHLANHEGYAVNKPTEFFEKYGSFLMLMLNMIKLGTSIAGHVVPGLSSLRVVDVLDAPQSALNSVTVNVIKGVDYSLAYLEESRTRNKKSEDADADGRTLRHDLDNYLAGAEGLEGVDLHQLRSYLTSNNSDNLLGNLYRMTTKEGHVKWVCRDHYRAGYQEKHTQMLREVVTLQQGLFNEQLGRIEIILKSSIAAAEFYDAVRKAKGVLDLDVSLQWSQEQSDFSKLKDMVSNSNIRSIKVDLNHKNGPNINIKFSVIRRYDPIFDIMRLPSIQSFQVHGIPKDFFRRSSPLTKADLSHLRHLGFDNLSSDYILEDSDFGKLKLLITQAPSVTTLNLYNNLIGHKG